MENKGDSRTTIAEDVEIVGSIKCGSDIQIDGKLNGDLTCAGNATLGNSGTVKGSISVDSVTVQGQVNGNITAKDRIELKSTARVNGDIRAKRLTVEDGVTFVGKSEVNPSGVASRSVSSEQQTSVLESNADDNSSAKGDSNEDGKGKGLFGKK